ncbi:(Fe-S)-binding protein [Corynebacterium sp.]|uniref:(Fe-S)-binding protein n=1 Tax=Corynebacterium sp. TaxID=1720 RepID=UPI0026DCA4E6|nr:(Fe-S)-binding protein [Corynebacterium sp.]MDO5032772.1 (Fe-S)-binding protein [Corynebacterium sp.]
MILGWIAVLISLPVWGYFLYRAWGMYQFVRSGGPTHAPRTDSLGARFGRVLTEVFGHTHFKGHPFVNAAHWAVMVGFLFGILVWFEAYIQVFAPSKGWPWLGSLPVYHFIEEVLGLATVLGITFLALVRARRPRRFENSQQGPALLVEAIVFFEGLGMLLVKASQIAAFGGGSLWADFITIHLATLLPASSALVSFFALVKLLVGMAFIFCISRYYTWGVMWHRFMALFTIFFQRHPSGEKALGSVETPDLDEDVAPGSWKMLLDSTTCTECGRCQDLCPAWNTGKPLSPKKLMMDLRDSAVENYNPHAGVNVLALAGSVDDDVLWSCTNCGACVDQCPVDIEHIDHVADLRRFKVLAESDFPSELTGLFKNMETKDNPWGRNNSERRAWIDEARADGIEVPVVGEDDLTEMEYLFWVGCAGAYDEKGRATTRAVVDLLHTAGVKFGVLATGESCTGDPARRAGNEFLFQMMAQENVSTLNETFGDSPRGQRKIITTCPHCFNTLRNEYPDFDGHFEVFHHTQLLNRLVREGLLTPVPRTPENRKPITYHDPCFLGRHNKVFDPPRELLESTGMELREMDHNRDEAFCCGAGGARMFMEEKLGTRVNEFRTEQALATGAEEIATGCPFCNVMMTGGVKALAGTTAASTAGSPASPAAASTAASAGSAAAPVVHDVAQMLRTSISDANGNLPAPRTKAFLGDPVNRPWLAAPAAPATPSAPAAPTTPSAPSAPAAPSAPSTPPAAPAAAPAATAPSTPAAPSAPAAPATPPAPSAPAAPPAPSAPKAAPAAPSAPTAPAAPPAPTAPVAPSSPAAPKPPSAPAAPSAPQAPQAPKPPSAPSTPAAPSAPAAPTPPAPKTPQAPQPPNSSVPQAPKPPSAD